jgi:alpha-L-rhamnosidase
MITSSPFSNAAWIGSRMAGGHRNGVPAPYLRKSFSIIGPIKTARLTATALGLYECELNGRRVGDLVFAPGWTEYSKRIQYQTYDVTAFLQQGENAIGSVLGDGWYCGHLGWFNRRAYGDRPKFIARLEIEYADGTRSEVVTDDSWKIATGPLLANDLLMGESYDARLELGEWSEPAYNDSTWEAPVIFPDPGIEWMISDSPPVRRIAELAPATVKIQEEWGQVIRRYDFGQNFSGRVRIAIRATPGILVTIRFAEVLNPDGTLYTDNLRSAWATDYYTCRGDGLEVWEPRFTFHGFRHVEIVTVPIKEAVEVTAVVLHSDTAPTGRFACSNPLLNQLQSNIVWGQKSNFLEVPTDCPQRDERFGWTGDAQVFIRTAAFNMDVLGFFRKWLLDMRDAQGPKGDVPEVIPFVPKIVGGRKSKDGGPAWADAVFILPWTLWLCYGEKARPILEEHYDAMRRYLDFLEKRKCVGRIRSHPEVDSWGGFGDWLALDGSGHVEGKTPKDLIGTAFYAYGAELTAKVAAILGRADEAEALRSLHGEIVAAFRRRFVTPEGLLVSGTQTAYVLGLQFGLIPEEARATALQELVRDIEKRGFHLATGFVGTPYLLDVLEEGGRLDVAYKLLEQETFPSWLFPVKNGATTIWERWDGWTPEKGFQDKGMNSFNHYAYGAVGAWMYKSAAGLDLDSEEPGYQHILFRPRPGGSLTWAEASLQTPFGEAAIHWEIVEKSLRLTLKVPKGARATLLPPPGWASEKKSLEPGQHVILLSRDQPNP